MDSYVTALPGGRSAFLGQLLLQPKDKGRLSDFLKVAMDGQVRAKPGTAEFVETVCLASAPFAPLMQN